MITIGLIGAGQLGSRHLQALASLSFPVRLQVVDPSEDSLNKSRERFQEVAAKSLVHSTDYFRSIQELSKELDLVIVATNSDVRRKVIEDLLSYKTVKSMVIEKFLFGSVEDYDAIQELLQSKNVSAWVNFPRRMFNGYKQLKQELLSDKLLKVNIIGSAWGFASNLVHFIDLVSYLSDSSDYSITSFSLSDEIMASKRQGYIEFNGNIQGSFKDGEVTFDVTCLQNGSMPILVEVISMNRISYIREDECKAFVMKSNNGWKQIEYEFLTPYQSQLSNLFAEEIIWSNCCDLPSFEVATKIHLPILRSFLLHLSNLEKFRSITQCPIT